MSEYILDRMCSQERVDEFARCKIVSSYRAKMLNQWKIRNKLNNMTPKEYSKEEKQIDEFVKALRHIVMNSKPASRKFLERMRKNKRKDNENKIKEWELLDNK